MTQWEYQVCIFHECEWEQSLNSAGKDCWELVSHERIKIIYHQCIFKRPRVL